MMKLIKYRFRANQGTSVKDSFIVNYSNVEGYLLPLLIFEDIQLLAESVKLSKVIHELEESCLIQLNLSGRLVVQLLK